MWTSCAGLVAAPDFPNATERGLAKLPTLLQPLLRFSGGGEAQGQADEHGQRLACNSTFWGNDFVHGKASMTAAIERGRAAFQPAFSVTVSSLIRTAFSELAAMFVFS